MIYHENYMRVSEIIRINKSSISLVLYTYICLNKCGHVSYVKSFSSTTSTNHVRATTNGRTLKRKGISGNWKNINALSQSFHCSHYGVTECPPFFSMRTAFDFWTWKHCARFSIHVDKWTLLTVSEQGCFTLKKKKKILNPIYGICLKWRIEWSEFFIQKNKISSMTQFTFYHPALSFSSLTYKTLTQYIFFTCHQHRNLPNKTTDKLIHFIIENTL